MHFTVEAQEKVKPYLIDGVVAVDATAGNGFDTVFLAGCVGQAGKVIAIDRQGQAIERTQKRLVEAGLSGRVDCVVGNHGDLESILSDRGISRIDCAMFNLGYLPHGDKSVVTEPESTLKALKAVERVLVTGGIVSILAYVGHRDGENEASVVARWIGELGTSYTIERWSDEENPKSPILWILRKLDLSHPQGR